MTRKQRKFNNQLDQYYMYQITQALIIELQNYIYFQHKEYNHLIDFTADVNNCSANIYIKNFEESEIGELFHMHTEDVYYIQRHYQHTIRQCIKRLNMYIDYLDSEKENI